MSEVCELVPSQKRNNKINVYGYLMVKERSREEKESQKQRPGNDYVTE